MQNDAALVLPCQELQESIHFFASLGFRLDAIFPADDPTTALLSGHSLTLRLERRDDITPGCLRLPSTSTQPPLIAPNGTRIEWENQERLVPMQPTFLFTAANDPTQWSTGRAGMMYRDLIPGRIGGHYIASQIRIEQGGPVPDYVHFHRLQLQMIYCHRGWVKVVYEGQGEPFVMNEGDCVLQPPEIRHRVLEASPGLEVIELASPAQHETRIEHSLSLPNATITPDREFNGQRFVRHIDAEHSWRLSHPGLEEKRFGIYAATQRAEARVARTTEGCELELTHSDELLFVFILIGNATLHTQTNGEHQASAGASFVIPPREEASLRCTPRCRFLELRVFAQR